MILSSQLALLFGLASLEGCTGSVNPTTAAGPEPVPEDEGDSGSESTNDELHFEDPSRVIMFKDTNEKLTKTKPKNSLLEQAISAVKQRVESVVFTQLINAVCVNRANPSALEAELAGKADKFKAPFVWEVNRLIAKAMATGMWASYSGDGTKVEPSNRPGTEIANASSGFENQQHLIERLAQSVLWAESPTELLFGEDLRGPEDLEISNTSPRSITVSAQFFDYVKRVGVLVEGLVSINSNGNTPPMVQFDIAEAIRHCQSNAYAKLETDVVKLRAEVIRMEESMVDKDADYAAADQKRKQLVALELELAGKLHVIEGVKGKASILVGQIRAVLAGVVHMSKFNGALVSIRGYVQSVYEPFDI